jgi:predicted secreted Zn-dependent protease
VKTGPRCIENAIAAQIEDIGARHVGRHQISGALNPLKTEPADTCQRFDSERLRQVRERLPSPRGRRRPDHDYELIDDLTLADYDLR